MTFARAAKLARLLQNNSARNTADMKLTQALPLLAAAALALAGCDPSGPTANAPTTQSGNGLAPPGAPKGTCWAKYSSPAVIETVTRQVLVTPAKFNQDGTISALPVYRSEDSQEIVTPRQDQWFEIPCPPSFTVEFVSTLQRALQVRGLYSGPISGNMDEATRTAVRAMQRAKGLDSDVISMETAQSLGLVIIPLEEVE